MRERRKQVSNKELLIGREIPNDVISEILSRLPAKSVARFGCVSKQWASILHRPHFTALFWSVSSTRPRLLFALAKNGKWLFLSAPQPLDPDQNSSPLVVDHHKPFHKYFSFNICAPVHGLVCTSSRNPMICNPSTGQSINVPTTAWTSDAVRTFFGYDPVNKIFKVLSVYRGYRVLTLGSRQLSWRTVECSIPQIPFGDGNGICINGVLYYLAYSDSHGFKPYVVVCFDVMLEKFKFLAIDTEISYTTLINFKGRLGVIESDFHYSENAKLELLVLDDADEQKWSKYIYVLPPLWEDITGTAWLSVVGMTCTGEIVLSTMCTRPDPFGIFYYNVERNTLVRVETKLGVVPSACQKIYIFVDHIENVKPMKMLRAL